MRGDTVGIQVRRRTDPEDALLLQAREDILVLQNSADRGRLGFKHIWPQGLGTEEVRDEAEPLKKECERREGFGG